MTIDDLTEALALLPRTAELLIEIVEGEPLKVSGIEATVAASQTDAHSGLAGKMAGRSEFRLEPIPARRA